MKKYIKIKLLVTLLSISNIWYAAAAEDFFSQLSSLISSANKIIGGGLTTLFMALAFLIFVYSVINFLIKRNNGGDGLRDAKKYLLWSVVGLFVMVAVWGLVNFLEINLLGGKPVRTITKPQTQF